MIICSDFDCTIYFPEDEAKTTKNLAALKAWRAAGNISILATNRSLLSLERALPSWRNYFDYLVLDGGTRAYDGEARLLWSNIFSRDTLQQLLEAAQNFDTKPKISFYNLEGNDFASTPTPDVTKICFRFHTSEEAAAFLLKIVNVDAYTYAYHHDSSKWHPDDPFKDYHANVEVIPSGTNKAYAIRELAETVQLPLANIATIGDNLNDTEMLTEFSGYAIENSKISTLHPNLKTTPSVANLVKTLSR